MNTSVVRGVVFEFGDQFAELSWFLIRPLDRMPLSP